MLTGRRVDILNEGWLKTMNEIELRRKIGDCPEWRCLKPYIGLFRNYWRFHAPIDEIPLNTVVASFNDKRACHFLHTLFVIKAGVLSA